jgi:uncharacterized integral membrane protein
MLRLFRITLVVLALGLGMVFALLNHETVTIDLLFDQFQPPLVALLIVNLLLGLGLGALIYLPCLLALRLELERTRKKLAAAEAEVRNLRNLPIQDA